MSTLSDQRKALDRQFKLFNQLLDLPTDDKRSLLLKRISESDPELSRQLGEMLATQSDGLECWSDTGAHHRTASASNALAPGERIGDYKILQLIGEGGMGQVYMAEQQTKVRRRVALKLMHPDRNKKSVAARFEAERQTLYRLDHSGIARILDSGQTANGQNFFVMELINGSSLVDYCDREKLSPNDRLRLFEDVCRAIHHAHQKGIIHRDIKPSNILVTMKDGIPAVKVIDFGIAKGIDAPLGEQTLVTRFGELIGTPNYMSPEQLEHGGTDLDIRSDIYSLGVLLYELLTGSLPHQLNCDQGLLSHLEQLRDSEPIRPSQKLTLSYEADQQTVEEIAQKRRTSSVGLRRYLKGDLDWIILKAMAKSRTERYESASALANDIQRFLNHEAVEAVAPSLAYRTRKVFQKHQAICVLAVASFVSLILLSTISTYWAISSARAKAKLESQSKQLRLEIQRSKQLEVRAIEAEQQANQLARQRQNEAVVARAMSKYFMDSTVGTTPAITPAIVMSEFQSSKFGGTNTGHVIEVGNPVVVSIASDEVPIDFREKLAMSFPGEGESVVLPEGIKATINEAFQNQAILEMDMVGMDDLPGLNEERLRMLRFIRTEQEKEFGEQDTLVGETMIQMARVYLDLDQPLKGQLIVHEAMDIVRDPDTLALCKQLLEEFKQSEPENAEGVQVPSKNPQ